MLWSPTNRIADYIRLGLAIINQNVKALFVCYRGKQKQREWESSRFLDT